MTVAVADVTGILDTNLTDSEIEVYITGATNYINQIFDGVTIDDDIKTLITTYMTAHMISFTRERQARHEKIGPTEVVYSNRVGEGLKGTTYGQMILTLDYTGKIAASVGKKQVSIYVVPEED